MSVVLAVNGQAYSTWMRVRITRGLKRGCADFEFEAPGEYIPAILPFMACTILDDGDLVLTGFIDRVETSVDAKQSRTVVSGRSAVMDLVDCMPEFATSQFNGYALDAIARAVADAFGVGVEVQSGVEVGQAFPDATFERAEQGFAFLARLARQRGIMLTDNAAGALVLATLGTQRAPAGLMMGPGGNVFRARGCLAGNARFQKYSVRSQAGIKQTGSTVQNAISAVAYDTSVPRYRPWSGIAESASLSDAAQLRALWEAAHRAGEAITATLSVPEWRANGVLWQCNQIVACDVPRLGLDEDLLISEIVLSDDATQGRVTELTVQPAAAFTPDPAAARPKGKGKGKKSGGPDPYGAIINVVAPPAGGATQ
jgi:prophage tail gpP-like protein